MREWGVPVLTWVVSLTHSAARVVNVFTRYESVWPHKMLFDIHPSPQKSPQALDFGTVWYTTFGPVELTRGKCTRTSQRL